jgi:hypothetical protein
MQESFWSFVITETREKILILLPGIMSIIVFIGAKAAERKEKGPSRNRRTGGKT